MKRSPQRCAYTIEKRHKGKRYVYARHQCKNRTGHESGYCHLHRIPTRVTWRREP